MEMTYSFLRSRAIFTSFLTPFNRSRKKLGKKGNFITFFTLFYPVWSPFFVNFQNETFFFTLEHVKRMYNVILIGRSDSVSEIGDRSRVE